MPLDILEVVVVQVAQSFEFALVIILALSALSALVVTILYLDVEFPLVTSNALMFVAPEV